MPGGTPTIDLVSTILHETRRVRVALPASYARTGPERRYPVTIVLDGGSLLAPVETVSRELAANGQIPESIVVGIENTDRLRDLTPPGLSVSGSSLSEGGDRFLDFIEKELLPRIELRSRTGAVAWSSGRKGEGSRRWVWLSMAGTALSAAPIRWTSGRGAGV